MDYTGRSTQVIGNYRLSVRNGRKIQTYIYPVNGDLRCLVDAMAALLLGRVVLIEPPGAGVCKEGGDVDFSTDGVPNISP